MNAKQVDTEERICGKRMRDSHASATCCPLCGGESVGEFVSAPDRFHMRHTWYNLKRCYQCACVWLPDPPTPDEMPQHYDEDYYKAVVLAGETAAHDRWRRHHDLISTCKASGAILDIGCSSGGFLGTMSRSDWQLFGIEMDRATAEKARAATGARVFVGNATEAPFETSSFDVITCFDVLEHVYDPRALLSRALEWLKPGGIFVTMLPNIDAWEARFFGSYWHGLELPRHLFHFSPKSLRLLAQSLGFDIVHLETGKACYVEHSVINVSLGVLENLGFKVTAPAKEVCPGVLQRALRKAFRVGFVLPFMIAASSAGASGGIEAVLQKKG